MSLAAPALQLTAAVTLAALILTILFSIFVSRSRRAHGVPPPGQTGPADFERALRVHGNTVEQLVLFIPALWLAALYFQGWLPPIIGLVWCVGRVIYAVGYSGSAQGRLPGFILTILPTLALIVLAIIGLIGAGSASNVY